MSNLGYQGKKVITFIFRFRLLQGQIIVENIKFIVKQRNLIEQNANYLATVLVKLLWGLQFCGAYHSKLPFFMSPLSYYMYLFKVKEKIYGLFEQKNSQDCQQTMQTVTLRIF